MEKMRKRFSHAIVVAAFAVALLTAAGASAAGDNVYTVTTLQSTATDSSLVNGWGLAALPGSPWWVADNGTNVSTLYNAAGAKQALTVQVHNAPTGLVANDAGTIRKLALCREQSRRISRTRSPARPGIASITIDAWWRSMRRGSAAIRPRTGFPPTKVPILAGSSSTKPTTEWS